jgi:hypothetical protein
MTSTKKIAWADDDPDELGLSIPVIVSKHGIKVKPKPSYVPPHLRDKSVEPSNSKK